MPAYNDYGFVPAAPVARVVLRHPESRESIADVPMLIDSGADATLLPKSAVVSLGIKSTANGINWKRSTAQSKSRRRSTPCSFS